MKGIQPIIAMGLILGLALATDACERESQDGDDQIEISVPEDAGEKLEEAGREVGEAVGEGMESVGGAIEEAGREVQEGIEEERTEEDTVHM